MRTLYISDLVYQAKKAKGSVRVGHHDGRRDHTVGQEAFETDAKGKRYYFWRQRFWRRSIFSRQSVCKLLTLSAYMFFLFQEIEEEQELSDLLTVIHNVSYKGISYAFQNCERDAFCLKYCI